MDVQDYTGIFIGTGDCSTTVHFDTSRTIAANVMLCVSEPPVPHDITRCGICCFQNGSHDSTGTSALWIVFASEQTNTMVQYCRDHYLTELERPGVQVPVIALLEAGFKVG